MKRTPLDLPRVCVIEYEKYSDDRGFFVESYNDKKLFELGISTQFVQDNHSYSNPNVIRGLHFQSSPGQEKLVRCTRGRILDVVVDIDPKSSTYKKWISVELSSESNQMIYIPVGYAHGFAVLDGPAEVQYKCSSLYNPLTEKTIKYNDPQLGIVWPINNPIISERDKNAPTLEELCVFLSPER